MLVTGNTANTPDQATLDLWRAAEAGDFGEVEAVLSRVADVNARNEHGVTALMRAAQHGHARIVRLLLLHGADANIVRNDKFTALSLAAFFGHTGVVRVLMEHGADSEASTRHGTSPHMWATARTFNEVVDQLKTPAPPKVEERPVTEPRPLDAAPRSVPQSPAAPGLVTSAIVRTLKDPPEIWDLVHEEQTGFNARSAFVEHLQSMTRGFVFRSAVAAVLICACVVGVWVLRGAQAGSEPSVKQEANYAPPAAELQSKTETVETGSVHPAVAVPEAAPSSDIAPPAAPVTTENVPPRTTQRRRSHSWVARSREADDEPANLPPAATVSVQRVQTQSAKTDVKVETESVSRTKSSSPLSPQLITPAKNVSTKSKVIQWP